MKRGLVVRIIFILTVASLCTFGATKAFAQRETEKKTNAFLPKKYTDVDIKEPNGNEYIINSEGELTKEKSAKFENPNNNTKDEYIRARVIGIIRNKDGSNAGVAPELNIEFTDEESWEEIGNYYYYKKIVKPGETTSNLFNDMKVGKDTLSKLEEGQYIEVDVIADSIESTKIYEAWGVKF